MVISIRPTTCHSIGVSLLLFFLLSFQVVTLTFARPRTGPNHAAHRSSPRILSTPTRLMLDSHRQMASNDWISDAWQFLTTSTRKRHQINNVKQTHADTSFTAASTSQNVVNPSLFALDSSVETSEMMEPGTVATPHRSKIGILPGQVLNNPPPTNVPPARVTATLMDAGDGSHMMVNFLVGASNSTFTSPDLTSVSLNFIIDTGSADVVLFNKSCSTNASPCDTIGVLGLSMMGIQAPFTLYVDGENCTSTGSFANQLLTMPLNTMGASEKEYLIRNIVVDVLDGSPIQLDPSNPADWNPFDPSSTYQVNGAYFRNADGIMGLNYFTYSFLSQNGYNGDGSPIAGDESSPPIEYTGYQQLVDDPTPFFSMNFRHKKFYLQGIDEAYRSKILWSDGLVTDQLAGFHSFRVYEMKMCGISLFENVTESWHALVDTGSSCLGLPAEFYDMVISWLPLRCNLGLYDQLPNVCYLPPDVRPILPTLAFRLAPSGQDLYIRLADLIYSAPGMNRTCLYRGGSILGGPSPANPITFGSRVLQQFYAAFDMESGLIGFTNVDAATTESTAQCAAKVVCTGMQAHYDALNICLPPPCDDYYFFAYEDATKECRLSTGFHILTGIIIGVFIFIEFFMNEIVIYLCNKVNQNAIHAGESESPS